MSPSFRVFAANLVALVLSLFAGRAWAEVPRLHIVAASHRGIVSGETLSWRSTLVVAPADRNPNGPVRVDLAVALPPGEHLEQASADAGAVRAIEQDGRIVGLEVLPDAISDRRISIVVVQPQMGHSGTVVLRAPIVAGNAVQIVSLTSDDELRFQPDPEMGLERDVGFFTAPLVNGPAREDAERLTHFHRDPSCETLLFFRSNSAITTTGGLKGRVSGASERAQQVYVGLGIVFLFAILFSVVIMRKMSRAARVEEAEAALRDEYERLAKERPVV